MDSHSRVRGLSSLSLWDASGWPLTYPGPQGLLSAPQFATVPSICAVSPQCCLPNLPCRIHEFPDFPRFVITPGFPGSLHTPSSLPGPHTCPLVEMRVLDSDNLTFLFSSHGCLTSMLSFPDGPAAAEHSVKCCSCYLLILTTTPATLIFYSHFYLVHQESDTLRATGS